MHKSICMEKGKPFFGSTVAKTELCKNVFFFMSLNHFRSNFPKSYMDPSASNIGDDNISHLL